MILPFSRLINGKPTYFPEKIITGLWVNNLISKNKAIELFKPQVLEKIIPAEYQDPGKVNFATIHKIEFDNTIYHREKIHTIREDKGNRWKPGVMIDFFINSRKPDMFRFAPKIPVVSVQNFEIQYYSSSVMVSIDGEWYGDAFFDGFKTLEGYNIDLENLAINDGFASLEEFFKYFDKDFKGKIIHWTDLKY
ncbi:hypothetical protein EGY05_08120 [Chryseobacterium arthrosphaerae]|uniref:hypothetical protein n=1 Tax=Chryseobacterium arthrosphaerae TaxID=651561 RepID=UPI000F4DE58F|nr:hypothetical protein [Chryseobacterium arthrosphaerae]AYZ11891.1 hypothetical protein EGY05_08120 [Chryseobacterium arthrosphaerae]